MKTTFQNPTTQLPETFHNEPIKKSPDQNPSKWSPTKIALGVLSTLGASYLTYQYSSPKINIPDSPVSSPIYTFLKVVGPLAALATLAGLITSNSTNRTNHLQKHIPKAMSSEEDTDLNENQNTKKITNKQKPTHHDIVKLLNDFQAEETINKALLEELITSYNDLSTTSPKETISNETFISDITTTILGLKTSFCKHNASLDEKKSILNKIIDTLDVFTDRIDLLSYQVVEQLFEDLVIPDSLHEMTQVFFDQKDTESKELVERSCQLVYQALDQQLKILFPKGIAFEKICFDKTIIRALSLLTPFEKDDFRLRPNFYTDFIRYSPQLAWKFIQNYIFESVINKETLTFLEFHSDCMIASILNARNCKDEYEFYKSHTNNEGWVILNNIIIAAKLALFSDHHDDEGAASFAIRLIQHKLKIKPKRFENEYPNDYKILKQMYSDLCNTKDLSLFKNFATENKLSHQATLIADGLKNECRTTFLSNHLLGTDITIQSFINKIAPLMLKKEYLEKEKKFIQILTHFIKYQIIDSSIPQRAELASLALNQYPKLFRNPESVKLIREAYQEVQLIENTELYLACQDFLKDWDALNESESKIIEIENPVSINKQKGKEFCKERPGTPVKKLDY